MKARIDFPSPLKLGPGDSLNVVVTRAHPETGVHEVSQTQIVSPSPEARTIDFIEITANEAT